jgi:hypothetical protein
VGGSGGKVATTVPSRGQDGVLGAETVDFTSVQLQSNNTTAFTVFHDEIQSKVFDEELAVCSFCLIINVLS